MRTRSAEEAALAEWEWKARDGDWGTFFRRVTPPLASLAVLTLVGGFFFLWGDVEMHLDGPPPSVVSSNDLAGGLAALFISELTLVFLLAAIGHALWMGKARAFPRVTGRVLQG